LSDRKLIGISAIKPLNEQSSEVEITFAFDDGTTMPLVACCPVVEQMLPALTQLVKAARESQGGKARHVAAENVDYCVAEMDPWEGLVVLTIVSTHGVPYRFALPPKGARDISERLKTEALKPHHQVGKA
jgi:hypothetical protein